MHNTQLTWEKNGDKIKTSTRQCIFAGKKTQARGWNVADMHIFKKQVANLCKIKAMRKAPKKERETVL